jgi:hypothetical protein
MIGGALVLDRSARIGVDAGAEARMGDGGHVRRRRSG